MYEEESKQISQLLDKAKEKESLEHLNHLMARHLGEQRGPTAQHSTKGSL